MKLYQHLTPLLLLTLSLPLTGLADRAADEQACECGREWAGHDYWGMSFMGYYFPVTEPWDFTWRASVEANYGFDYTPPVNPDYCDNERAGQYVSLSENWTYGCNTYVDGDPQNGFITMSFSCTTAEQVVHGSYISTSIGEGSTPCTPEGTPIFNGSIVPNVSYLTNLDIGNGLSYTGEGPDSAYFPSGVVCGSGNCVFVDYVSGCCEPSVWFSEVEPVADPPLYTINFANLRISYRLSTTTDFPSVTLAYKQDYEYSTSFGRYYRVIWQAPYCIFAKDYSFEDLYFADEVWWSYVDEADLSQGLKIQWKIPIPGTEPTQDAEGCVVVPAKTGIWDDIYVPELDEYIYFNRVVAE
jgi:hypothetical protein